MPFSVATLVSAVAVAIVGVHLDGGRVELDAGLALGEGCLQREAHRLDVDARARLRGSHGVARRSGVERERRIDGIDIQIGCRFAQRHGGGIRVDADSRGRGVGVPGRRVPHRVLAERPIGESAGIDGCAELGAADLRVAFGAHEHDRGLGELLLHRIRGGSGCEAADRHAGDRGSGGDEHERYGDQGHDGDACRDADPQCEVALARCRFRRCPRERGSVPCSIGGSGGVVDRRLVGAWSGHQIRHSVTPRLRIRLSMVRDAYSRGGNRSITDAARCRRPMCNGFVNTPFKFTLTLAS